MQRKVFLIYWKKLRGNQYKRQLKVNFYDATFLSLIPQTFLKISSFLEASKWSINQREILGEFKNFWKNFTNAVTRIYAIMGINANTIWFMFFAKLSLRMSTGFLVIWSVPEFHSWHFVTPDSLKFWTFEVPYQSYRVEEHSRHPWIWRIPLDST